NNYDATAGIICCSKYSRAEDFAHCGERSFNCGDTHLCPRCSYRRLARPLLDEFGNAFTADNEVWYIVLSLSSDPDETHRLIFRDLDGGDLQNLKHRNLAPSIGPDDYGVGFANHEDVMICS